jgi:para-nitrobenzyl esterase
MFVPVPDGVHIGTHSLSEAGLSASDHIPLIVSTTLDDAGLFFNHFEMTEQQLSDRLSARYGSAATTLQKLYREYFPTKSPYLLHAQIVTDAGFRRFAHAQAEAKAAHERAPVYTYLWEWTSSAYNGKLGAVHAMDVAASFDNVRDAILGSGSSDAQRMCNALASTWVAFAKTGDPNNSQIPHWPRFAATERTTMVFDHNTRTESDPHRELREFWRGMPPAASVMG